MVPRAGPPVLVVALTFRVKPWIERTSRVAEVIFTPRIGIETARLIAAKKADAAVGVVDFDSLSAGIADDLREAGPRLAFSDASELFAALRAGADPAEIMLTARASSIATSALSRIDPREPGIGAIVAAVEGEARRLGAEEVYVAAAPDLARDRRLVRIESTAAGEPALGARFAVRASVAYKGSWVRRVVTIDRDLTAARTEEAAAAFAEAVARLPSDRGLSQFASFVVEGCRLSQPLEALMGSRVAEPRPPAARRHRFGASLHRSRRPADPARRPGPAGRPRRGRERFRLATRRAFVTDDRDSVSEAIQLVNVAARSSDDQAQINGRGAGIGVGATVRISHFGAVRKRDRHELAAGRSVAERMDDGLDFHAGRQGLGNPALPRQAARPAHLDRPLLRLALGIGNRHQDPAVRIGPLEFLDGAFQGHLLFGIEHGEGMMREGRHRRHGEGDTSEAQCFEVHERLPRGFLRCALI